MICGPCKGAHHDGCHNVGKDTNTWCDCQHRAPGADDVIVFSWVRDHKGVTRKLQLEDVVSRLTEKIVEVVILEDDDHENARVAPAS